VTFHPHPNPLPSREREYYEEVIQMKNVPRLAIMGFLAVAFVGCGIASREIKMKSKSERTDVFSEVKEGAPPKGFADLLIKASIKTHIEGYHLIESKGSLHGKQVYPFVLNVDGQAATWEVEGEKEITPFRDERGRRIPEGGEGIRYNLEKKIRLSAGSHKAFFALPGEGCAREFEITLREGESHTLEVKPIYRIDSRKVQSFLNGVRASEVFLDGKVIQ
jgi:hypothetical protein